MVISTITDFPQPVSKKMLFHWVQLMSSSKFKFYEINTIIITKKKKMFLILILKKIYFAIF